MPAFNLDAWAARSGAQDLSAAAFQQAETRLQNSTAARVDRPLVDRFCKPVGPGVQPPAELNVMARYLFAGEDGRVAVRRVDETIRQLPGFASAQLLEA
jgi:hypothetical protein